MHPNIIDRGRGPEIAGTRITVYDVWDYLKDNCHHTDIAMALRISSAQVQAAVQYIEEHKSEVLAEYQKMLDREAQGNPPEIQAKLQSAHAKLQAMLNNHRRVNNSESTSAGNPHRQ
jgi:uncharacterized protein (DUF433 family)